MTSVQRNSVSENTNQFPSTSWPYFGCSAPRDVAAKNLIPVSMMCRTDLPSSNIKDVGSSSSNCRSFTGKIHTSKRRNIGTRSWQVS